MRDLRIRRVVRELNMNTGRRGLKGDTGSQGEPGEGVPDGGTVGQVLTKQSNADYDTDWETPPTAPVTSVNGQTGDVVLDAIDVGADAAGSAAQALSDANDYTDSAVAGVDTGVMSIVAGDNVTVDNSDPANPVVSAADAPAPPVTSVNGRTGAVTGLAEQSSLTAHTSNTNNPHSVTKSQVGLGNADNTSDADKPISTATQNALNLKLDASRLIQGVGFPNGSVTAPVGTIYVDTAMTNGASSWIKKSGTGNTGWVVLEGDTGWRNITSDLVNGWTAISVQIRRLNNSVSVKVEALNASGMNGDIRPYLFMQGFQFGVGTSPRGFLHTAATPSIIYRYYLDGALNMSGSSTSTPVLYGQIDFTTTQTWPSSLPGTPA